MVSPGATIGLPGKVTARDFGLSGTQPQSVSKTMLDYDQHNRLTPTVSRTLTCPTLCVPAQLTCGKRILSRGLVNWSMNSRGRREIKRDIIM